jgi:hypothetical protein
MRSAPDPGVAMERAMRAQILERLDEFCRGLTLGDVRQWYYDSLSDTAPLAGRAPAIVD